MPFPVIQLSEILFEKGLIEIKQLISLALGTDYTTFFYFTQRDFNIWSDKTFQLSDTLSVGISDFQPF